MASGVERGLKRHLSRCAATEQRAFREEYGRKSLMPVADRDNSVGFRARFNIYVGCGRYPRTRADHAPARALAEPAVGSKIHSNMSVRSRPDTETSPPNLLP